LFILPFLGEADPKREEKEQHDFNHEVSN